MFQIQFLDRNVAKALVPVFSRKPDKVAFLYDESINSKRACNNYGKSIQNRFPQTIVEFRKVDKHDYSGICAALNALIEEATDKDIEIVINGGTELMSAAGMRIGTEKSIPVIYVSTAKKRIFNVFTDETVGDIVNIGIADYLTAIGAKSPSKSHTMPEKEEYEAICKVAEYLFDHLEEWHRFQTYLSILESDYLKDKMTFSIDSQYVTSKVMGVTGYMGKASYINEMKETVKIFAANGLVKPNGSDSYSYCKNKYKEWMTTYGIWLEMYIYVKALDCFDEVHLGYVIDWDNSDNIESRDNELDVVAVKNSVPYLISCKMRKPTKEDVYEIACLADRVGGSGAKALIATTFPIDNTKGDDKGIYKRLKEMKVRYIVAGEVAKIGKLKV